jgi:hypothetical protein
MKDGPEKQRLEASLKAFGTQGDNNGVNVSFGAVANGAAGTTFKVNDQTNQVTANVTFDPIKISSSNSYAIDAAREGTHIEDWLTGAVNATAPVGQTGPIQIGYPGLAELSDFSSEYRAYQTSAWAASALGLPDLSYNHYEIWNSRWGVNDSVLTHFITETYTCPNGQHYQETPRHNPWPW